MNTIALDDYHNISTRLMEALAAQPMPPCVGCPYYEKCSKGMLACDSFWAYINPPKSYYGTEPALREKNPSPTRELFDKIYVDYD